MLSILFYIILLYSLLIINYQFVLQVSYLGYSMFLISYGATLARKYKLNFNNVFTVTYLTLDGHKSRGTAFRNF